MSSTCSVQSVKSVQSMHSVQSVQSKQSVQSVHSVNISHRVQMWDNSHCLQTINNFGAFTIFNQFTSRPSASLGQFASIFCQSDNGESNQW